MTVVEMKRVVDGCLGVEFVAWLCLTPKPGVDRNLGAPEPEAGWNLSAPEPEAGQNLTSAR